MAYVTLGTVGIKINLDERGFEDVDGLNSSGSGYVLW
jgi:hypothetical protein